MANEIVDELGESGLAVYSVLDNMAGQVWNGSAFVTEVPASRASYDVPQTELSTSGRYRADWPPAIAAGRYRRRCYVKPSAALDASDLDTLRKAEFVDWDGAAVVGGYLTAGALADGAITDDAIAAGMLRRTAAQFGGAEAVRNASGVETYKDLDGATSHTATSVTVNGTETVTRA